MFKDESSKARAAFEKEVNAYEQLVKKAVQDLKTQHSSEMSAIVSQHKSELQQAITNSADVTSRISAIQAEKSALEKQLADAKAKQQQSAAAATAAASKAEAAAKVRVEELEKQLSAQKQLVTAAATSETESKKRID